jgi:hypothetical protein
LNVQLALYCFDRSCFDGGASSGGTGAVFFPQAPALAANTAANATLIVARETFIVRGFTRLTYNE